MGQQQVLQQPQYDVFTFVLSPQTQHQLMSTASTNGYNDGGGQQQFSNNSMFPPQQQPSANFRLHQNTVFFINNFRQNIKIYFKINVEL
jgi:hypothetical protein